MAISGIDVSGIEPGLNKREFLRALGFEVADKGKFTNEQANILAAAEKTDYEFHAPAVVDRPESLVNQSEIDLMAFREWQISKGRKAHERGRISQAELNEYVTEVPDFPRREVIEGAVKSVTTGKIEIKPLPDYDAKAARKWAIAEGLEVPERGRLPRWIAEKFIASHADAGTEVPKNDVDHTNNFGPAGPRLNMADFYEGYTFDYDANGDIVVGERVNNDRGGALVKKSFKDADVKTGYSIGYVPGYSFAWDPRDSDEELVLLPVR